MTDRGRRRQKRTSRPRAPDLVQDRPEHDRGPPCVAGSRLLGGGLFPWYFIAPRVPSIRPRSSLPETNRRPSGEVLGTQDGQERRGQATWQPAQSSGLARKKATASFRKRAAPTCLCTTRTGLPDSGGERTGRVRSSRELKGPASRERGAHGHAGRLRAEGTAGPLRSLLLTALVRPGPATSAVSPVTMPRDDGPS